jgi:cis-3-alkyl-4-acyloxetan-2-one decarboxylase
VVTLGPAAELYPFHGNYLPLDGGKLHYLDEGDKSAPVLLMLHGNPTWSFYYRELVRAFRGKYRVIAVDHLGCGLSDKPQDWDYTLANHIANIVSLVERLELRNITLIVHDWGGAIGMGAAVQMPERFSRFVVFNTAAFPSDKMPFLIGLARVPGLGPVALRGVNAFVHGALATCVMHKDRITPAIRAGYTAPYDSWANRVAILRFVEDIPRSPKDRAAPALDATDKGLAQFRDRPMLLIWGAKDYVFDDWFFGEWKKRFPAARSHYVEDAGHFVVEDAFERIIPWIEAFLG